jgi:hypothetical protein
MLKNNALADFNLLTRKPGLFLCILLPLLLVTFLKLSYPLILNQLESLFKLAPENWLTLTLITIISTIPIITGVLFSYMHTYAKLLPKDTVLIKSELTGRMAEPFILSEFLILLSVVLTNPVPSEGWLRIISVSLIFSLLSPYVYLVLTDKYLKNVGSAVFYVFLIYWILAIPVGLLLSRPLNYLAFVSPFYWISWTWLTPSRNESIFLAAIFLFLISFNIMIVIKTMSRNKKVQ